MEAQVLVSRWGAATERPSVAELDKMSHHSVDGRKANESVNRTCGSGYQLPVSMSRVLVVLRLPAAPLPSSPVAVGTQQEAALKQVARHKQAPSLSILMRRTDRQVLC